MSTLLKKVILQGEVYSLTGLHIGGTNSAMGIGGPDSVVIRNPITNRPYIPGSSLKGKMRSLIEQKDDTVKEVNMGQVKYGPTDDKNARAAQLFGATGDYQQPSRVIVRDGQLLTKEEELANTDLPFTESKTEVVIDRVSSAAMPRQLERVPAGARFHLDIVLNIHQDENEQDMVSHLLEGLVLVSDDYLGGNGSRGSGKVAFKVNELKGRSSAYYTSDAGEENLLDQYQEMINKLHENLPEQ